LFRAATSALLLSFACTPEPLAQEGSTTPEPEPGTGSESTLDPKPDTDPEFDPDDPEPPPPSDRPPGSPGAPCLLDADCGADTFCQLRICVAGCPVALACDADEVCDPHGRCVAGEDDRARPHAHAGAPTLTERQTVLALGETRARTILHNDGAEPLTYRLAAASPALTLDTATATLEPGQEVELVVDVDRSAPAPADRVLPVQVITSGGALLWAITLDALPAAGHFRGAVSFDVDGLGLASSSLALDLDFRNDGTIVGRVDHQTSLLWPQTVALTGTWGPNGDVALVLRDRLPAGSWRHSPIARELGRELTLTGKRSATGLAGTVIETITGLRGEPVAVEGAFTLHRRGPLSGLVHPPDFAPKDAPAPTWLAPPDLDAEACDDLAIAFGTDATLVKPSPACDACADGSCSADDMYACAMALRTAGYNLAPVLTALHGKGLVSPPSGAWTWDDCAAQPPGYNAEGRACLDITALRCAHALMRRGPAHKPGPAGALFRGLAAVFAADEAVAAGLLATEAQIDAAFAFKGEIGEPVADAFARELAILTADRERLAAALALTLAPAYLEALQWIEDNNFDQPTANAHLAPLQLAADFARTTAQWARLAHRAGKNPQDLRAAVRLAAIAMHAASAELHARLADRPAAGPGLHALGPALQLLATVDDELAPGRTPFGYPTAYVPLALGPEDLAKGRSNFDAVQAIAADEIAQFAQVAADAWHKARDYEQKTHTLAATELQIATEYDAKLRALCGSLPGDTKPALATCGAHGGQIAELRAAAQAAGLRIRHAVQAGENNLYAIAVEEERFARVLEIHLDLGAAIQAAHGRIFQVRDTYGDQRSAVEQAEAMAECGRIRDSSLAEAEVLQAGCASAMVAQITSGPTILGVTIPNVAGLATAAVECDAKLASLETTTENQCQSVLGQAGLQRARDELQRAEDQEITTINAEIDAAVRASDLELQRAASVALIKNIRAEGLLLQIEIEEAELARRTAMTAIGSAFQEVGALAQDRARTLGLLIQDSPDNARTRPHFLQARLEAAARVLPARERTIRRVYLALRALEYELNQELPALRSTLAAARSPEDITALMTCLAGIAKDYRLKHGFGQPYVTEVSLRTDILGMTADIPDVDGSPATPAEQFAALLQDPLHRQADGAVALPFALSAFEHALFSSWLCDDRIDRIEVKLVGDFLGDREAEVLLTRQGLAGVRRCDGADLPQWSAYVPYSFEREQIVIQAGVNEWGTAGPNAGYAAWPVHGEQWTLTIPPPAQSPANADLDLAHISDVVLRLHHRAGTIAPAGQGTFTPSCG